MPYSLRKAPNRDLYWVVNKETTRHLSDMPLPREKAVAQLKALYARENILGYKIPSDKKDMSKSRMEKGSELAKEKMKKVRENRHKKKEEEIDIPASD
jgi:stringent starvation protein B